MWETRQAHESEVWRAGYEVGRQPAGKAVSPRLNPLIAASHVVRAAEASREGASAETAAHHADDEDDTAMEGARQFQHHFGVSWQLESWRHIERRTHLTKLGAMHACEGEGAMLITNVWQLMKITRSTQCQLTTHSLVRMARQRSLCWSRENTSANGPRRFLSRAQEAMKCGLQSLSDRESSIVDFKNQTLNWEVRMIWSWRPVQRMNTNQLET